MRLDRPLLRLTWAELRRRHVVRAAVTYAVVAWVVLQIAEITYEPLGLPPWALTWTVLAAVLGLPVVLVVAWFFDVSHRGVSREKGAAGVAGPAFAVAVVLLTVGGIGWWLSDVYDPARVDGPATASVPGGDAAAPAAPANAVAVLPFDDMSPRGDQGFLADGIAEELLDRLARSPKLRVAARTSSFALREEARDVATLGRQLNVRWVVEGSVRKDGGRIRVTAQLIDTRDGFHAWSDTYEHPDSDLFALQDEVTRAIASALSERIGELALEGGNQTGTDDPAALEAYLRGREAWRLRTPAGLADAEAAFQQAVELDPAFARAWSGLADTYLLQSEYGTRPLAEAVALAEPAAVRAVGLGPELGEAWASVGLLRTNVGQLDAARRSLEQAVRLDPRYEMAPMWLAQVYGLMALYDQQLATLESALQLNPLEPVVNVNFANALARSGDAQRARDQLLNVLAITPTDPTLLRGLADLERGEGRLEAALKAADAALDSDPEAPANILALAQVLLVLEDFGRAGEVIATLPQDHRGRLLLAQEMALRQGGDALVPGMADWIHALPPTVQAEADRAALTLAGFAMLRAQRPADAATLLSVATGDPGQLAVFPSRTDSASLLLVALQRSGRDEEAAELIGVLEQASAQMLGRAGDNPQVHYVQALRAAQLGEPEQALGRLETAVARGFRERWLLRFDPRLGALTDHPRVAALAAALAVEFQALRQG